MIPAPSPAKAQSPAKQEAVGSSQANGQTSEGYAAALVDWENDFILEHRRHIEESMRLTRQEMSALSQVILGLSLLARIELAAETSHGEAMPSLDAKLFEELMYLAFTRHSVNGGGCGHL